MNRKEFGKLVVALRKEHRDIDDSIWTQAKLAEEANLSKEIVGNVERGSKEKLEPEVFIKLAKALRLTSRERKEFLIAASGVEEENIPQSSEMAKKVLDDLLSILQGLQTPAFISNYFGNLLAINSLVFAAYDFDPKHLYDPSVNPEIRLNVMRALFAPEFQSQRNMMGETWDKFARHTILLFGVVSFRYRGHPYFRKTLLPELNKFPLFRKYWQSSRLEDGDLLSDYNLITLNNPHWGLFNFVSDPIQAVTPYGSLNLYSFQPLGSDTAKNCLKMAEAVGITTMRLADWPEKSPGV